MQHMQDCIKQICNDMRDFLLQKNKAYGDSVANPIHIFAKSLTSLEQVDVRIDDKLNRLMRGTEYTGDDTVKDLCGYLLLRMALQLYGEEN